MITDIENIILNKEYFELTSEELESVSELVQNAEEYDEMKWFLASTKNVLVTDKIEATPELKEKVMSHLHQDEPQRKFWLNGLGIFLWPTDKEVVRRPAFQMSLAALLLIGFLMVYNNDIQPENDGMAVNDVIDQEEMYETSENKDDDIEDEKVLLEDKLDTKDGEVAESEEIVEIDALLKTEEKEADKSLLLEQPVDEIAFAEAEDAEKPMTTVTDADGFYYSDVQPAEVEEELNTNSVSNANNNEGNGSTSSGYKLELDDQADDNRNKDTFDSKPEKKKDKFKTRDQSRKNKRQKSKESHVDETVAPDFDLTYGNMMEPSMDTTTVSLSNNRVNNGSDLGGGSLGKVNDPGNVSTEETQTNQPNGGFGLDGNSDIIPNQMSVSQTGELKSLFKTYK